MLGVTDVLGIELDKFAVATAYFAGHDRLQADVAALSPHSYPCTGLIASPPCPTFSTAGKGAGRRDIEHVIACARDLAGGRDTRAEHRAKCEDGRSMLTVEPLRWALAFRPEWVALEQVPPVLSIWELFARLLAECGYSTWTGILEAERYGVPQTRERAFLLARQDGKPCHPPAPTHQRYVPGQAAFEAPQATIDGEILPWVSMAEALGCDDEGMLEWHGERCAVPKDEPVPVITSKARSAEWVYRNGSQANAAVRRLDLPAPTVHFGHRSNKVTWTTERRAVRVTVQEGAILQGFPPDYPWSGPRTQQLLQVGNAVPPPLARVVLAELVDGVVLERAAKQALR